VAGERTSALICDTGALLDYIVAGARGASIVALAEELGIRRLATRDIRHFAAVRLRDGSSFELVVHPTAPDGS